jgi:hypothetical protein
MNTYEKNMIKDTGFSGGLLVVAVAWIVFAAVQGPVSAPAQNPTMTAQNAVTFVRG